MWYGTEGMRKFREIFTDTAMWALTNQQLLDAMGLVKKISDHVYYDRDKLNLLHANLESSLKNNEKLTIALSDALKKIDLMEAQGKNWLSNFESLQSQLAEKDKEIERLKAEVIEWKLNYANKHQP